MIELSFGAFSRESPPFARGWHWHGRVRPLHSPTRNTPSAIRFVEWSARIDNQLPLSQSLPPVLEHIQNDSMYERGSIWCVRMDGSGAGVGRIGR